MDHLREQADVTEPTTGPRPHGSPRAESLAARLAALAGGEPRVSVDGFRTRVEADLPTQLTNAECRMLYLTLGDSDHCGIHPDGYAWAELLDLPDLGRLTADQCAGYACALCGAGLYTAQFLGSVDGLQLWACSPACQANPLASD